MLFQNINEKNLARKKHQQYRIKKDMQKESTQKHPL